MTSYPLDRADGPRNLVADAARSLSAEDPLSHVFFEERADLRMNVTSSGIPEVVTNRTRGAAIVGRRSIHLTDPNFADFRWIPVEVPPPSSGSSQFDDKDWVARLEGGIAAAGTAACAGRRNPFWSAKLVSFHQEVWVGSPGSDVLHDIRRGCRMEVRVQVGNRPTAFAVGELILGSNSWHCVQETFVSAFDRAEKRASASSPAMPGSTTAVFAPGVAGVVIHELIGHALEGDVIARGCTWVHGGDFPAAVFPVTVVDDPRRGRGTWAIDDEGVASRETLLIDRGRPVGVLLDRSSAGALGRASTGHGRRSSYLEAVLPRMGCTFIMPGGDDPADVLRGTRAGVFIRRMAAGHTDPVSGRASFVVGDADRIVDGRLAEPLDVFVLELDGLDSWRSIDRIAHDLAFDTCIGSCVRDGQPLAVSVGAPTIRIGVARVHS